MFLLNLHVAVWVVAVATRSWPNVQIGLFLAICGAVYGAQFLNAYGARHWQALGLTQNYFDDRGVFISFMYSLPLLSAAGFQMVGGLAVTAVRRANLHELACACSRLALGSSVRTRGLLFCRHRQPPPQPNVQLYAFFTSSSLLIKVKRAELRTAAQRRAQLPAVAGGGGSGAGAWVSSTTLSVSRTGRGGRALAGRGARGARGASAAAAMAALRPRTGIGFCTVSKPVSRRSRGGRAGLASGAAARALAASSGGRG
jgi:hypothetical protein